MLKLFAFILTVLSAIPTLAMHSIKMSRLRQRAYATITKKDFDKLIGLQEDNYPLRADSFASALAVMEKDEEDVENLLKHLSLKMNLVENGRHIFRENLKDLPTGLLGISLGLFCPNGLPLLLYGVYITGKSLSGMKKNYSEDKAFKIYKTNIDHLNALLNQKKDLQECLQHEVVLEKNKDRHCE